MNGDDVATTGFVRFVSCNVTFCEVILVMVIVTIWPDTVKEMVSHYKQLAFVEALRVIYDGTLICTLDVYCWILYSIT